MLALVSYFSIAVMSYIAEGVKQKNRQRHGGKIAFYLYFYGDTHRG